MAKHKFRVVEQRFYAMDYTYEVEATCESDARSLVATAKAGEEVSISSLYGVYDDEITSVIRIENTSDAMDRWLINRVDNERAGRSFHCLTCSDAFSTDEELTAHTDATHHRPALDK